MTNFTFFELAKKTILIDGSGKSGKTYLLSMVYSCACSQHCDMIQIVVANASASLPFIAAALPTLHIVWMLFIVENYVLYGMHDIRTRSFIKQ